MTYAAHDVAIMAIRAFILISTAVSAPIRPKKISRRPTHKPVFHPTPQPHYSRNRPKPAGGVPPKSFISSSPLKATRFILMFMMIILMIMIAVIILLGIFLRLKSTLMLMLDTPRSNARLPLTSDTLAPFMCRRLREPG